MPIVFWAVASAFGAFMGLGALQDPNFPPKIFADQAYHAFVPGAPPPRAGYVYITH